MPGMVGFRIGWFGWYGFRGSKSWGLAHKVAQSPEGINQQESHEREKMVLFP